MIRTGKFVLVLFICGVNALFLPPPPPPPHSNVELPPLPPSLGACGVIKVQGSRVINGQNAETGAWPWQVLLRFNNRPFCGAVILNPFWVATATHCLTTPAGSKQHITAEQLSIVVGATSFMHAEKSRAKHQVKDIFTHPGFTWTTLKHDIGLIRLQTPIHFNNFVQPVCVPTEDVKPGTECTLTGWGRRSRDSNSGLYPMLQQAKLPVISSEQCKDAMKKVANFTIDMTSLCAGTGHPTGASGCHGDSGGPFVCQQNGQWNLHGVVSWGAEDCGKNEGEYSVFTRVTAHREWMDDVMSRH